RNPSTYTARFVLKLISKITLLKNTRREITSAYYELKLRHRYNKVYLHNIQ
ncbi:uncharacterized protein M421DRAFT_34115, partial [Didymella exigua CBS 183.55]